MRNATEIKCCGQSVKGIVPYCVVNDLNTLVWIAIAVPPGGQHVFPGVNFSWRERFFPTNPGHVVVPSDGGCCYIMGYSGFPTISIRPIKNFRGEERWIMNGFSSLSTKAKTPAVWVL